MRQLRRRRLLFAAGMLFVAPLTGWPQQKTARIGILASTSRFAPGGSFYAQVFDVLKRSGWVEGRNLAIDWRYAEGKIEAHDQLARELVALKPDVIFAATEPSALAVSKATSTIPIVFALVAEPVEAGLAVSLARPGRNATGASTMQSELVGKRLELLREAFPSARRIALLYQPDLDLNIRHAEQADRAARRLGIELQRVSVGALDKYDATFAELGRIKPDAVYVMESPGVFNNRREIVRRINGARLIAMYGLQEFAKVDGLMSYSVSWSDQYRRAATYIVKILAGAKPGDLPIEQPTKFELVVNLKTAKALGLTISPSLLQRADEVIQ